MMEINGDVFEMDKAALMHYKENLIFILKKNTAMHEKLSYLQSFEDLGVMKLGCIDSNDHNYRRFIDRLAEAGMPLSDDKLEMVADGTDVPEFRLIDDSFDKWIKWEPK